MKDTKKTLNDTLHGIVPATLKNAWIGGYAVDGQWYWAIKRRADLPIDQFQKWRPDIVETTSDENCVETSYLDQNNVTTAYWRPSNCELKRPSVCKLFWRHPDDPFPH